MKPHGVSQPEKVSTIFRIPTRDPVVLGFHVERIAEYSNMGVVMLKESLSAGCHREDRLTTEKKCNFWAYPTTSNSG